MLLSSIAVGIVLAILGLVLGSFAGATVWRLRARQLQYDKAHGEPVDRAEWKRLQPLTQRTLVSDRSQCLRCGYTLRWYDLVPLFSWLSLGGKCRQCRKPIGRFEPLIELGTAAFFVLSLIAWPVPLQDGLSIALFATWLAAGVVLAIMFAYDAKWFLLPDSTSVALAVLGAASVTLTAVASPDPWAVVWSAVGAVAVLSGLYLMLWTISRGGWVGFGDVKLGVGLGLLLGQWELALLALFLANLIGVVFVLPLMAAGKVTRKSHVPFGPMLILGTVVAQLCGWFMIDWYVGLLF